MFFLFIFIILLILGLAVYTSRIRIEIDNLIIDTEQPKGEKINKNSEILVYIVVFKKLKILKRDSKNIKFQNKDIDIKFLKNKDFKLYYKELLKNIDIEQIDLNIQLGTQDAAVTAILTGIISTSLGMILKKPKYEIIPIYSNRNFLKIKLDGIFSVQLMQYIYKLISYKIKDLGKDNLNKKVEV